MTQNALNNFSFIFDVDNIRLDGNTITVTDTNGSLSLESNGTGSINIGTNATAHTTTLGSSTSTSSTRIQSGTGDIDLFNGSSSVFVMTSDGERNMALQPATLYRLSANNTNQTGDGTVVTMGVATAFTSIFDQGSDQTAGGGSASTFTAPVAGNYRSTIQILWGTGSGTWPTTTSSLQEHVTSNRNFRFVYNWAQMIDVSASYNVHIHTQAFSDFDAMDTATWRGSSTGGTKIIGNRTGGVTDPRTWLSMELVC